MNEPKLRWRVIVPRAAQECCECWRRIAARSVALEAGASVVHLGCVRFAPGDDIRVEEAA